MENKMTERILDLTLEIICLLTGEDFLPLKAGDRVTITMPLPNTLLRKGINDQKILEATKKMMELLTEEVPIRCQDVSVYFSMEEWEYLGGHRDLYKDVVMENEPPLTSPDGSRKRNPPERCSSPVYSGDSSQEDYRSPWKLPGEEPIDTKVKGEELVDTKYEGEQPIGAKFEDEEPLRTKFEDEEPSGAKFEGEEPVDPKAEGDEEEEESYMMGDQSMDEEVMMVTIKEEDFSSDYELYGQSNTTEGHPDLSPEGELEEYAEVNSRSSRSRRYNSYRLPGPSTRQGPSAGRAGGTNAQAGRSSRYGSNPGGSSLDRPDTVTPKTADRGSELFSCSECGKSFTSKSSLRGHQKLHTGERPFSCTVCAKTFIRRTHLNIHQTTHVGERPFKCTECGKGFSQNSDLRKHLFSHSGEFPFSCGDCGKGFPRKSELIRHRRSHTGERPYECTECGKCFMDKSQLTAHKRYHSGERPYICSECGKSFAGKSELNRHWSVHSGLKPFWCFECGKGFTLKSSLVTHQRRHAGDMQYSCAECGKSFVARSALARHEVIHTGIKPYPCSKCDKSYLDKSQLIKHELVHAKSQS